MTPLHPWFGLVAASLAATRGTLDLMAHAMGASSMADAVAPAHARTWTTPHVIRRELTTMRVLDFSIPAEGASAIIVAPFALHTTSICDFAPGHSVVEALIKGGVSRILLTDWRSATQKDRYLSIDSYLADLNVLADDTGAPVALVGLCQGGWLAAAYAARFPAKVAKLAIVGAPIDIEAGRSAIADIARATPAETISEMVALGDGLLLGRLMMAIWPAANPTRKDIAETLQLAARAPARVQAAFHRRYTDWYADVIDLPGIFYQQTAEWIFRENRLAKGAFVALGERICLGSIVCPLFLLAARQDEITDQKQLLATADRVATAPDQISSRIVPGRHLSLFMGKRILANDWPDIARFLRQ